MQSQTPERVNEKAFTLVLFLFDVVDQSHFYNFERVAHERPHEACHGACEEVLLEGELLVVLDELPLEPFEGVERDEGIGELPEEARGEPFVEAFELKDEWGGGVLRMCGRCA